MSTPRPGTAAFERGLDAGQRLALRKHLVLARSAALRRDAARQGAELAPALLAADQVRRIGGWLVGHPKLAFSAATLLWTAHKRGWLGRSVALSWRWLLRGYTVWQIWRRLSERIVTEPRRHSAE